MTIEEVEKTVRRALNEFRQTMLNEHTAREITQYIIERLRIERHLREIQKHSQEGAEHAKDPAGVK